MTSETRLLISCSSVFLEGTPLGPQDSMIDVRELSGTVLIQLGLF
jgi:hypothetical protein